MILSCHMVAASVSLYILGLDLCCFHGNCVLESVLRMNSLVNAGKKVCIYFSKASLLKLNMYPDVRLPHSIKEAGRLTTVVPGPNQPLPHYQ